MSLVKVRAFSLNEELRPANRSVFLKFKVRLMLHLKKKKNTTGAETQFCAVLLNLWPFDSQDPDQQTVDIVEMLDLNNGIPTMQNPFKIPVKPK